MNKFCYGIIGNGRMAKHFKQYLQLLKIDYIQWRRGQSHQALKSLSKKCSPILILINDDAIHNFIEEYPFLKKRLLIHFSGKLITDLAYGVHPLCSFSEKLYALEIYQKIPFIYEDETPPFETLLPNLNNPHFELSKKNKIYYHAMCVLAGNYTILLWQKFFNELENRLQIPKSYAFPYLEQVTQNLFEDSENALTGPLVRCDTNTIDEHLRALKDDSYKEIYEAFVKVFQNNVRLHKK